MKPFMIVRRIFPLLILILSLVVSTTPVFARLTYGSGEYTNVCGSGTAADSHACSGNCNPGSGSCSYPGATVVKYTCDGRQTECRSNESGFSSYQSVSGVSCGKTVQIDVFNKTCRGTDGSWNCGDGDLRDYIVWYSGDCSGGGGGSESPSCRDHEPINTQFRESGQSTWISGDNMNDRNIQVGDRIDVNCFAKNGTSLLPGARIEIRKPDNVRETKNGAELRNYPVQQNGAYSFRCYSTTLDGCADIDSLFVDTATPQSCNNSCSDASPCQNGLSCVNGVCRHPSCVAEADCTCPVDNHVSQCTDLNIVSGNDQQVPATVTLRAEAEDNKGSIQRYRFFFGDGTSVESNEPEVKHTYETSGTFYPRADIKDSKGNWVTNSRCEALVDVRSRSVESHRSGCSTLAILEGNREKAPSTVRFKVSGFDNKGGIKKYRVDYGNGVTKEGEGREFEQVYSEPGTYTVKAYVLDSQDDWIGGDNGCKQTVYIETEPITKQPDTGTPTALSIFGVTSGIIGAVALMRRYALMRS